MLRWSVCLRGTPKRILHHAVGVGHKVYCFGCDKQHYIEVHIFNTVSSRWIATTGRGECPPEEPLSYTLHTAVLVEDIVYIWGGLVTHKQKHCNVLYAFDVDTHRWFKPKVSGTVPEGSHPSACVLGKVMYVYGGYSQMNGFCHVDDIYKLDTSTMVWSVINTGGTRPPASYRHSANIIGTKMFVFGGRGAQAGRYNSISVFDTETNCWLSTPSIQLLPKGRADHSAFTYNGELYIFGGNNWGGTFNDLWKFNPETFSWKKVEPKGKAPCSWMSAMCCCMVGDRIILFGGYRYTSVLVDVEEEAKDKMSDLLYNLHLSPNLQTLCKLAVIQYDLEQSELPHDIRWELAAMTTNRN